MWRPCVVEQEPRIRWPFYRNISSAVPAVFAGRRHLWYTRAHRCCPRRGLRAQYCCALRPTVLCINTFSSGSNRGPFFGISKGWSAIRRSVHHNAAACQQSTPKRSHYAHTILYHRVTRVACSVFSQHHIISVAYLHRSSIKIICLKKKKFDTHVKGDYVLTPRLFGRKNAFILNLFFFQRSSYHIIRWFSTMFFFFCCNKIKIWTSRFWIILI